MTIQLDIFSAHSSDIDAALAARDKALKHPTHQAVTDLIAADPIHARERANVVEAMEADHRAHGHVNPNCVRNFVEPWVSPRVLSAMYGVLRRAGVLVFADKVPNLDSKGRNLGKDSTVYSWVAL